MRPVLCRDHEPRFQPPQHFGVGGHGFTSKHWPRASAALASAEKAVEKAEKQADAWRAQSNEWRAAMTDREARFVTRESLEAMDARVKMIEERLNITAGERSGLSAGWGILIGAVSLVAALISLGFMFRRKSKER